MAETPSIRATLAVAGRRFGICALFLTPFVALSVSVAAVCIYARPPIRTAATWIVAVIGVVVVVATLASDLRSFWRDCQREARNP